MITNDSPVDIDADSDLYFMQHRVKYQGRCMTVAGWASYLGLTENGMRSRYQQFGLTPAMFVPNKTHKNDAWSNISAPCCKNPLSLSRKSIFKLVAYLIDDAKQEMLVTDERSLRFKDAQNFLKDVGGGLSWWLACLDIDIKDARTALREYATSGYKKERKLRKLKRSV